VVLLLLLDNNEEEDKEEDNPRLPALLKASLPMASSLLIKRSSFFKSNILMTSSETVSMVSSF
jgi:hypothetical protein